MKASVKYLAIYKHRKKYAIQTMCEFFGVSRSGYYGYVKRMDKPEKHLEVVKQIAECQRATRQTYGYRRVTIWLKNKGIELNPKTILRLMNKYDLLSCIDAIVSIG